MTDTETCSCFQTTGSCPASGVASGRPYTSNLMPVLYQQDQNCLTNYYKGRNCVAGKKTALITLFKGSGPGVMGIQALPHPNPAMSWSGNSHVLEWQRSLTGMSWCDEHLSPTPALTILDLHQSWGDEHLSPTLTPSLILPLTQEQCAAVVVPSIATRCALITGLRTQVPDVVLRNPE